MVDVTTRRVTISMEGRGLRGESQADILRRTGQYGVLSTDSDAQVMAKLNAFATSAADRAEDARDDAELFAFDATTALDLTKLSLYGEPDDKDASLILDFCPDQYLSKAHTMTGGERANAMIKTVLSGGPALASQDMSTFVTFTRSTTATRVNSAGLIETVAANVARIDYHPVTKECLGFLSERASTNLLLRSAEFDNAIWAKTGATVTPNAALAPDGTMTADALIEDTSVSNVHRVLQSVATTAGSATASIFLKPNGRTRLRFFTTSGNCNVIFDLSTATVFTATAGTGRVTGPYTNGFYRYEVAFTTGASETLQLKMMTATTDTYTGDGVSGVYLWGAQLEAAPFATSYIPTAASQVTRVADSMTITGANFTRFFNHKEGTIVVEYDYDGPSNLGNGDTRRIVQFNSTTVPLDRIGLFGGTNDPNFAVHSQGVQVVSLSGVGTTQPGVRKRAAAAYALNDYAFAEGGVLRSTDSTGGPVDTIDTVHVGTAVHGRIKSIKYFPTRLSNAKLQELSA